MGISKRELLNEYCLEEIGEIMFEYNDLHTISEKEETKETVTGFDFFGF